MKKRLNQLLLAGVLFAGMHVSAQVTDISTGVNSGGLIPYFAPDDDWTVLKPGASAFISVGCGGGYVQNGADEVTGQYLGTPGCSCVPVYTLPGIRWLSPYLTACTYPSLSYLNGAHIPWVTESSPTNVYTYHRTFEVTRCNPDSVKIKLSFAQADDILGDFIINGHHYPAPTSTPLPWVINVSAGDVVLGTNTLEVTVPNSNYDTGMGLKGTISVTGGANADPAFALSLTGGNLVATGNAGSHTWEVYGSNSGTPGSYASVGTYTANPLSLPAIMKCYYVKHTITGECGSLCDAQSICKSECAEGPNPCSLAAPTVVLDFDSEQVQWSAVTGASHYILQVTFNDPACCPSENPTGAPGKSYELIKYGTSHKFNFNSLSDFDTIVNNFLCFAWKVTPVCASGIRGNSSASFCSHADGLNKPGRATGILTNKPEGTSVNIFPNPAKGIVSFEVETATNAPFNVTITDITGRTVKTFDSVSASNKKSTLKWNTESMARGTYLVKIQTADHQSIGKKLIIE